MTDPYNTQQTPAQQETFLQRQRRINGQQQTGTTQPRTFQTQAGAPVQQPSPLSSPVSPTGRVSAQQPMAQPAPQPVQQLPAQQTAAPAQNPQAYQATYQSQAPQVKAQAGNTALKPADLGNDPWAVYQGREFNVPIPQLGDLPQAYAGTEFSQFAGPNQQETTQLQNNLLNAILRNPETMNPTAMAQMKEQNREQALLMEKQLGQQLAGAAAGRGLSLGGGLAQAQQRQLAADSTGQILRGNRDVDMEALARNRQDQLNALQAAEGVMSGQVGRAGDIYRTMLTGQQAQAGDDQTRSAAAIERAILGQNADMASAQLQLQQQGMSADEAFRGFQSTRSAQDAEQQRRLAQFGINEATRASTQTDLARQLQDKLGSGGLAIDRARLSEQSRQFNSDLGYRYNQLDTSNQQALLDAILGMSR